MSQWLQEEIKKMESRKKRNADNLPFAAKSLEMLHLSLEELEEFDAEMMGEPLMFIENGKRYDNSIVITKHYIRIAFTFGKTVDYGIFRLSDIAMTYCTTSKSPYIFKPQGKIYDILLLDANGERMGGVSLNNETDLKTFNDALETYAPHIRLNVYTDEIKNK